jgi:hypothetical protein
MTNYFRKPDALVDAVNAVLSGQPVQEKMDPVDQKALKGKHSDRKDKDIDNDGDVDSSDEYLHKRRKAVSKAMKEETEDNPANRQHLCAKNVVHESWGEGSCIPTMHADPDEDGNIEWYDVMFDHGIEEQVSIEELKVTKAESHMHSSKKKIKESKDEDDDDMEDDEDDSDEDEENGKKKKVSGKKDDVDVEPEMDDTKMVTEKEMTPAQEKKREEIVLSMKKEMPRFKKKYGDRAKDVMYATATKMAMKEGFELGIKKSDLIEEVELDEAKMSASQIATLKKAYEPMRGKKISMASGEKLSSIMDKVDDDKQALIQLVKADIPFVSQLAITRLITKHDMKGAEINKLREEVELDEDASNFKSAVARINKAKSVKDLHGLEKSFERIYKQTDAFTVKEFGKLDSMIVDKLVKLDEAKSGTGYDLYHKDFSSAMQHAYDHAKKKHGITINPKEIDDKVATGPAKPKEGKTNSYRLKGDKGAIQVQVYNKGGSKPFELNMYKEEVELDEAKVTKKERDRLEDQNEHGLLALKLAKAYGTPAEVKKIEAINKKHQKDGSIERKDQQERDSISNKYYKMAEETELDEGRGRPRKDGTKSDTDDREHIQMQLRKSVSLRGLKDVEFDDGKKVKVPAKVAQGVMSKINSIKDAKQKHNAVQHIAKSHKHMMDFHKGDYKDADAKRQDILKLK